MTEMRPEHYLEMGADPSVSGMDVDELVKRLERRIQRNKDCSGIEHDLPSTSEITPYSAAVVAVSDSVNRVNNS